MKQQVQLTPAGIRIVLHPDEVARQQRRQQVDAALKKAQVTNADLAALLAMVLERLEALEAKLDGDAGS